MTARTGFQPVRVKVPSCLNMALCAAWFTVAVFICDVPSPAAEPASLFRQTKIASPRQVIDAETFQLAAVGDMVLVFPGDGQPVSLAVLTEPTGSWRPANLNESSWWQTVFAALGHGAVLISHEKGLICLGGRVADEPAFHGLAIQPVEGALTVHRLPCLPQPTSHGCGAVMDGVLYFCGVTGIDGGRKHAFWSLDLNLQNAGHLGNPAQETDEPSGWKSLEPWPEEVHPHTAVVQDGSFFLFGRRRGTTVLDERAYRFAPRTGWKRIADIPRRLGDAVALPIGPSHVLLVDKQGAVNPMLYHTITDTWRHIEAGQPFQADTDGRKTPSHTSIVSWQNGIIMSNGRHVLFVVPQRTTQKLATLDVAVLSGYLLLLMAMGIYFARRGHNSDDYFRAGQRIPWWAAGISLLGTSISAITFMAIPAMTYRTNWVYLLGNLMIVAVAPPVIWYYLPFYRRLDVTSAYEYLERRFGLATRLVGSATFMLFQLGRVGIVVYLPALVLSAVTGWNVYICIGAIGLLAMLYTTLGGIEAVIWTDVLQVIVLIGGALVSFVVIVAKVPGGIRGIVSTGLAEGKFHAVNLTGDAATTVLWVVVLGNFFKFLIPYSSDQAVIQRYMTTSDERQAARSIWLNAAASVPLWTIFFALGTTLWAFYRTFPAKLDPVGRTDEIFAWFIVHELPAGIAGLVVAALFAASMSSLDSSMNSMATVLVTDFFRRLRPQASDRSCLALARMATVLIGLVGTLTAVYLAWVETQSIWDQFLKIMGLFGGGLAGLFVAGIFTRRTHQTGVLLGFAASAVALNLAHSSAAVHFFLYGAIGILTCSIIGWLTSLVLPGPHKNVSGLTVHSLQYDHP